MLLDINMNVRTSLSVLLLAFIIVSCGSSGSAELGNNGSESGRGNLNEEPVSTMDSTGEPREVLLAKLAKKDVVDLGVASCNADLTVEAEENESAVIVSVYALNNTPDDCMDAISVRLKEPLGDRAFIDATSGEAIKLEDGR